ncbi:MAG: response regulator [Pseudomonadota bacterium]
METERFAMLVVDDEPWLHFIMRRYGPRIGLNVITASSCVEAREALGNEPGIVILLCDMNLGDENGIELIETARRVNPGIIPIGMSGSDDAEADFRDAGADYFLKKPFTFGDVERLVRTALEKRQNAAER